MSTDSLIKLTVLEAKIDMTIQAYEIQMQRLKEENELFKDVEHIVKSNKKWIWLNEKRIELLNDLKK